MIDSGLIILSRFPIVESDELIFNRFDDVDAMSAKGAVFAKIKIDESFIYLFSTHT